MKVFFFFFVQVFSGCSFRWVNLPTEAVNSPWKLYTELPTPLSNLLLKLKKKRTFFKAMLYVYSSLTAGGMYRMEFYKILDFTNAK